MDEQEKNKLKNEIEVKLNNNGFNDDMIDISDDNVINKTIDIPNKSVNGSSSNPYDNVNAPNGTSNNIVRPEDNKNEALSRNKNDNPYDPLNNNKLPKKDNQPQDNTNLNNKSNNNNNNNKLNNNLGNNLKNNIPKEARDAANQARDAAKEALNEAKKVAKDAGAKAAGVAITSVTGGVVPPKLGEKVAKHAINKADKKIQKKGNQALNNVKEKTKEKVDNFKEKHKDEIEKAGKVAGSAVKAVNLYMKKEKIKKIAIISVVVIAVISFVAILNVAISNFTSFLPGVRGEMKNQEEDEVYSAYSKRDKKILKKLQKSYNKNPDADPAFVMAIVSYPHYGLVRAESSSADEEYDEDEDKNEYDYANFSNPYEKDEDEDDDDDEDEDFIEDDMYLNLFSERKYRKEFEDLMEKMQKKGKSEFESYLRDDYFDHDKYYKKMIKKSLKDDDDDRTKAEIKDDLLAGIYAASELYENYFENAENCATGVQLVGNISINNSELLKAGADNILVDVKEESCTTSKKINKNCESMEGMPITLEEYVKGVVWTEMTVNSSVSIETVKAQMVAAKSYVLTRYENMGWDLSEASDGRYVIPIRPNTNDQDYCDYKKGCHGKSSGNAHGIAGPTEQQMLADAWEAVKNVYIVNDKGKPTGGYCANREKTKAADCSWCKKGTCLSQTELTKYSSQSFENILVDQYYSYALTTIEGENATAKIASTGFCSSADANKNSKRNALVEFVTKYAGKIPYVNQALAKVKGFEGNNFGIVKNEVTGEEQRTGLGTVGFINWVYWSTIDLNFGNTNDFNQIMANGFDIEYSNILAGDIGYSADKSLVGIYMGDNTWAFEDEVTDDVVIKPTTAFTKYLRLNYFKSDSYEFTVRDHTPTASEWGGNNMPFKPVTPSLMGECPWYAKNRAIEIINEVYDKGNITDDQYKRYVKRVKNTFGNGADFYPGGSAGPGYSGSTNIADIKAGSFFGMSSQWTPAGRIYGHVAVVEYVSDNLIVVTDGWRLKNPNTHCSTYSDFSCVVYRKLEFKSYNEFYNYYHNPNGYMLKGYLYFLED